MTTLKIERAPARRAARPPRIAVFIPCLNESATIGVVIDDFRRELPAAAIWVIDNGSTDDTATVAAAHGAEILTETRRGKGFAVRTAFREIDADIYVMVDGDDTYPAEAVHDLLAPILAGRADMTVGSRTMRGTASDFRVLNRLGNRMYAGLVRFLLRVRLTDILSGYRGMTRQLVRTIPIAASGFEIEAELTVKTVERSLRVVELPINLRSRPQGSASKINMFGDGARIAWTILLLFRDYKPLTFFGGLGLLVMLLGLIPGLGVIIEFAQTGLVPRLPSAILAAMLEIVGILLGGVGFVLSAISRRFQEIESKLDLIARGQVEAVVEVDEAIVRRSS
jgi:glycosyltransferase involved in cell wall biosynthesis